MGNEGELPDCTQQLLRNPDKISEWLSIADQYMQTFAENNKKPVLPKAHEWLEPIIDEFGHDLEGFTGYLIALRDKYDRHSATFKDIQAIYRRVGGRLVQRQRRERMTRAIAKAEELYGEIPFMARMQWMANLEHAWAKRRLEFLEANRKRYENERIPSEDREELLAEFWETIDNEIYEGKVPAWNSQSHGVTPP